MAAWVSRRYRRVGSYSRGRSIRRVCSIANSSKAPSKASRERCGGQANPHFLEAFALSREKVPLGDLRNAKTQGRSLPFTKFGIDQLPRGGVEAATRYANRRQLPQRCLLD